MSQDHMANGRLCGLRTSWLSHAFG